MERRLEPGDRLLSTAPAPAAASLTNGDLYVTAHIVRGVVSAAHTLDGAAAVEVGLRRGAASTSPNSPCTGRDFLRVNSGASHGTAYA